MRYNIEHDSAEAWSLGDVKIALTPREFDRLHAALTRHLEREHEDMTHQRSDHETLAEDCKVLMEAHGFWQWAQDIKTDLDQIRSDLAKEQA